jgi:hypothetical protein
MISTNALAALVHALSALILFIFYQKYSASQSRSSLQLFKYEIAKADTVATCTTNPTYVPPSQCDVEVVYQRPSDVLKINVIMGSIFFFLFTAAAHTYYATDGFKTGTYTSSLQQGWNPYRWFEYAISASVMSVLLGTTEGVRDVSTLFLMAVITAAMQLSGFATESLLRGQDVLKPKIVTAIRGSQYSGWALFVGLWVVLFYNFGVIVHDVKTGYPLVATARVPSWIWIIVIAQFFYYASFGFVQHRHIAQRLSGKAFDYHTIEKSYIALSFTAKLSLAAGLGYGFIFRTKDCP